MGEQVTFPSNGGTAEGYLALPARGSGPAVIVIQEWWGLDDHIRSIADRLAGEGFVAMAPDLYHGTVTHEPDEAQKLAMGLQMDQAAQDINGAATYLGTRADLTGPGIGAVGFCMGGALAIWTATLAPTVTAAVAFYPALPWEMMAPEWGNFESKAALIHTDEDEGGTSATGIETATAAIEGAGGEVTGYDYPGTEHAFFNDTRPEVYNAEASGQAWDRTLSFLREKLS